MPILNGLEATKIIRKIDKKIPIIAFSANVMKDEILEINNVGMDEILVKPIDTNKFYNILLKYIRKKIENKKSENIDIKDKTLLQNIERTKLFRELELTLETMQPKKCDSVIKKIQQYKLLNEDQYMFEQIKEMIEDFEFEEASELLKGIL